MFSLRKEKKLNTMVHELRKHCGPDPPITLTHIDSSDSTDDVENPIFSSAPPPPPPPPPSSLLHAHTHKAVTFSGTPPNCRKKVARRKRRFSEKINAEGPGESEGVRRNLGKEGGSRGREQREGAE